MGKLRVLFAQREPRKQILEIRIENDFRVCTSDFRTSFSPPSGSPWPGLGSVHGGVARGQPDIDVFNGSALCFYHGWNKKPLTGAWGGRWPQLPPGEVAREQGLREQILVLVAPVLACGLTSACELQTPGISITPCTPSPGTFVHAQSRQSP